ncbi:MAG: Na+/H+ antiporter subunit E [Candidatus Omnitrophica bacterium]|nr:Na+/H+ antiporter subunit E [Candidatus Omnitrophota bacterium]MCM8802363.1 Na+/H+ antiporter subunit E [Candidatus Omnitrophota bacterium]
MKRGILTFLLFIAWIFLTWPFGKEIDWQVLVVGFFISILSGYIFGEGFTESPHKFFGFKRYLWAIAYIPVLIYWCIIANLDVAYRVLHPNLPIRPGIVKVKTRLRSKSGLTVLANSITLTPGTMSVEIDSNGYLYIHWIYVKTDDIEKATEMIVRKFEKILERIFE